MSSPLFIFVTIADENDGFAHNVAPNLTGLAVSGLSDVVTIRGLHHRRYFLSSMPDFAYRRGLLRSAGNLTREAPRSRSPLSPLVCACPCPGDGLAGRKVYAVARAEAFRN